MPSAEHVYVADNGVFRKIGVSKTPVLRCKQLSASSGLPVSLAFTHAIEREAFDVEGRAHKMLHLRRVRGEWFDVTVDEAICAIRYAARDRSCENCAAGSIVFDISQGMSVDDRIRSIDEHLSISVLTEADLGVLACGNPNAIRRIKNGTARIKTLCRVLDYIQQHPAGK